MNLDKSFGLSTWAIKNKSTVYVITFIIFLGGLLSYISMPRENFPEVSIPTIFISSVYPGNSAEDVERFITDPIEDELKNISGISKVESSSLQDYSIITIEFDQTVDVEIAKQRVKDKVDIVKGKSDWPTMDGGAKVDPYVFELNLSEMMPIMNINLKGDYTPQELKGFAEDLQDEIENFPEIKEVNIRGVEDMEVEIAVDMYKMTASTVTIYDIVNAIQRENVTISGGNIIQNEQRKNIRVVGQIREPQELEDIIVKRDGGVVYLKDVAEVHFRPKDKTSYAREYQEPVIMLDMIKKSEENQLVVSDKINELLSKAKGTILPNDVEFTVTNDMSVHIRNQVSELENSIIFGVLLVVSVLMFFLGVRNALFVGVAIPLSMLLAFLILSALGVTLNMMTLFAAVMGLGMLVDNGIVVVENVHRLMSEGLSRKEASIQGLGEIALPIIASTATTLAAFVPLAFWPGIMGEFMIYFPMTLSIVLGASLFVALVINAMLTSRFMKVEEEVFSRRRLWIISGIFTILGIVLLLLGFIFHIKTLIGFGNLAIILVLVVLFHNFVVSDLANKFQNNFLPRLERIYEKFLFFALKGKNAYVFFFGTIGLLFLSLIMLVVFRPNILFFPESDPNQAIVYIEYPEGTDIEKVNRTVKDIETKIIDIVKRYDEMQKDGKMRNFLAESVIAYVGKGSGNPMVDAASSGEMPNKGKVVVLFREYRYRRGVSTVDILNEIRESVKGITGASVIVEQERNGPPSGYPINLELFGDNYTQLMNTAVEIKNYINTSGILGIEELNIDVSQNKPEREVIVDRQKAGRLGLSTSQIGTALREAIYGYDASTFKSERDDYDIYVRFNKDSRYDIDALMQQELLFRDNQGRLSKIPMSSVATIKDLATFSSIKRKNLKRVITLYSNVLDGYNGNDIVQKITKKLDAYNFPSGISYKFTGEQEEMAKNMNFLSRALLIALAMILLIIVAQFNSISKPTIIMFSVVLSFIGVFLGLLISGSDFVIVMTMMGIIALAGIVVNNAIVLIDYTQLLIVRRKRELGLDVEEDLLSKEDYYQLIVEGGKSRLKPVLLTAITTILGLIPLAIGFNIDFFSFLTTYNPNIYMGGDNTNFWGPISWTIIYGLTFATFLTLVIVPVMFYLLQRIKIRIRGNE